MNAEHLVKNSNQVIGKCDYFLVIGKWHGWSPRWEEAYRLSHAFPSRRLINGGALEHRLAAPQYAVAITETHEVARSA
jgi:hypothetical protein